VGEVDVRDAALDADAAQHPGRPCREPAPVAAAALGGRGPAEKLAHRAGQHSGPAHAPPEREDAIAARAGITAWKEDLHPYGLPLRPRGLAPGIRARLDRDDGDCGGDEGTEPGGRPTPRHLAASGAGAIGR